MCSLIPFSIHIQADQSPSFQVKEYNNLIPPEFTKIFNENQLVMSELRQALHNKQTKNTELCSYSTEIPHANCNRGVLLLSRSNWKESLLFLDQIHNLGFQSVTLDIHFPLLYRPFHKTEQSYNAYLGYYKALIQAIREKGMSVFVESQIIFTQPEFSTLPVKEYYKSLSFEAYKKGRLENLKVIARELKPDYLTIGCEPLTEAQLSGQPLIKYEHYLAFMEYLLNGLRDDRESILVGAGFGTWEKDYLRFATEYTTRLPLDFINLHVYPLVGDQGKRMLQIAELCQSSNRPIVVEEAWLYKVCVDELSTSSDIASSIDIFKRDSYSFFQPLDEQFVDLMLLFSATYPVTGLNFFWSHYFFGYLLYDEVKDFSYSQIMKSLNEEVYRNYHRSMITNTGCAIHCFLTKPNQNELESLKPVLHLQDLHTLPYIFQDKEIETFRNLSYGAISVWFQYTDMLDSQSILPIFYAGTEENEPKDLLIIEIGHNKPGNKKLYFTVVHNNRIPLCFDSKDSLISSQSLEPGQWYHFVVNISPKGNTGFLNGIEMTNRHYNFGDASQQWFFSHIPIEKAYLGYGSTKYPVSKKYEHFYGVIEDFMIFDKPLSGEEVKELWKQQSK